MDLPPRNAPLDQRIDAIGDLITRSGVEIDGVRLADLLGQDLHDAAAIVRHHHANCPPIQRRAVKQSTGRKATLRRHYG